MVNFDYRPYMYGYTIPRQCWRCQVTFAFIATATYSSSALSSHPTTPGGVNMDAKACDALEDLCHHLHTQSHINKWKIANVTEQIHNTWAQEWEAHIDDHVHTSALRYHRAWAASLDLQGHGDWEEELQVLNMSDVRVLYEQELTRMRSGQYNIVLGLWCWMVRLMMSEHPLLLLL